MRGNRGPWTVSAPRSGPCCTGSSLTRFRRERRPAPAGSSRTRACAASAKWRSCGSGSSSTGACSNHAAHTSGGDEPGDRLRRFVAHAAGVLVRRVLSLRGGGRAARKSAASTATAAGSSMRSGKPCSARERRASSAPACRIAARSWSLMGCRAVPRCVAVPSVRPAVRVRALRADARARPGTGPPPGRSLTVTAPRACARASVPR